MGSKKEEELNAEWPTDAVENESTDNQAGAEGTLEKTDPLEVLQEDYKALNDKYLRLYSDFENFRKRTTKERIDLLKSGGEDIFKLLLPIIDDFERARANMEMATDVPSVKEGVELIYHKMVKELGNKGLKPMETKGEVFDSEIHEAITQFPAPTEDMKGKVVDELEKGYYLNDKVIRFAKVVVGS
ncbi:MAG: nucleotide exchange factor GrpE [Flavobacteriales bacterium]|nr:nucleotide exchange factor GrpE [Flavobacteriales bacterium]